MSSNDSLTTVRATFDLTVRDVAEEMSDMTEYSVNSLRRSVSRIENGDSLLLSEEGNVREAYSECLSSHVRSDAMS